MSNGQGGAWQWFRGVTSSAAGAILATAVVSAVGAVGGAAIALWLWTPVPPGAVVAFDLEKCPDGWRPHVYAAGRVIVGVQDRPAQGDLRIGLGDLKGSYEHDLSEPTPLHSDYTRGPPSSIPGGPQGIPWLLKDRIDNMPPYIGLRFCTPE